MSELFIEVRCEELPARFVAPARDGLVAAVGALLEGIASGPVTAWSTPRRVAVRVEGVAPARPVEEKLVTGPPEAAAFKDGRPTKAAEGFARGRGVPVDSLQVVEGPAGRVVAARVRTGGERTADRVARGLGAAILGISFPKVMRWGSRREAWARPIHSVVALLDGEVIPAEVAGVRTGRETHGHRLGHGPFEVHGADSWLEGLRARFVEPDALVRRERILAQIRAAAARHGASVEEHRDLLDEVVNLVEWPVVVEAAFAPDLLELPPRLLVEAMKVHQRVFPLLRDGRLTERFLVVTNHPPATDPDVAALIALGNSRVIAARFHDARFFFAEDKKRRLEDHGRKLESMQWIRKGGTMAEKAARISRRAAALAPVLGVDPAIAAHAGALSKSDLATLMVGEFPELQGHVGRLLATCQGEDEAVALAIEEHYLPRFSGDALPLSGAGRALAIADRVDTLRGCFAMGLAPKGSADPLGLRRAANGLVSLAVDAGLRLPLAELLGIGGEPASRELVEFCLARFRAQQMERAPTDVVDAVLATGDTDLVALAARVRAMAALARSADYLPLKTTFKRVMGLARGVTAAGFDAGALAEPAERDLAAALGRVAADARRQGDGLDYEGALLTLSALKAPVDRLFTEVFVMADDLAVRARRLALLRAVADEFGRIADFTVLSA